MDSDWSELKAAYHKRTATVQKQWATRNDKGIPRKRKHISQDVVEDSNTGSDSESSGGAGDE